MSNKPPLTEEELRSLLAKHGSWAEVARATGRNASTVQSRANSLGIIKEKKPSLSKPELESLIRAHGTWEAAARATGIPVTTLKSRGQRLGIKSLRSGPGAPKPRDTKSSPMGMHEHAEVHDWTDKIGFTQLVSDKPWTPDATPSDEELIAAEGKNPDEWKVTRQKRSKWEQMSRDAGMVTLNALGVWFGRRDEYVDPDIVPTTCGQPIVVKPPKRRKENERKSELVIVMSDFHAPYHDRELLERSCEVLAEIQPDRVIINGDLMDFPNLSSHQLKTLACRATPEECLSSGREILAALRAACPADTRFQFLSGNHDAWLHSYILNNAGSLADVMAPDGEGGTKDYPALSLRHLLQFDHLGIEMVGSEERWLHSKIVLTPDVVVRHGIAVRRQPIQTIIANSQDTDYATISGHTHRAGTWPITRWKADDEDHDRNRHRIVFGAEIGGMFKLPEREGDWPVYLEHQMRWQPGWASVEIEEDDHYGIDLASWQNGVLMWRGQRY